MEEAGWEVAGARGFHAIATEVRGFALTTEVACGAFNAPNDLARAGP